MLVNDPAAVRHVLATNAANYVRPTFTSRVARPLIGDGLFLAEGSRFRQQRRMLSPVFTPHNVGALLPHFSAAADDLVAGLERAPVADLSAAFQDATLEAVLRALFSMPDSEQRAKIGVMVRSYVAGPGRPNILDALARTEDALSFASAKRRAFQRAWFATVDEIVAERGACHLVAAGAICSISCSPRAMRRRARCSVRPKYATNARR